MRRAIAFMIPFVLAATPTPDRMSVEREIALGIPPQPPRVSDLYRRARPARSETWTGMLVCSIEIVGNGWDGGDPSGPVRRLAGRPEVDLEVTIGEGSRPIRFFGQEDTPSVIFAMPATTLTDGLKVKLEVEDRDVVRNDPVGTVELTFDGELPMRGNVQGLRVECRGAGEREVDAGIVAAERILTTAMAPLGALPTVDADAMHFGFDHAAETHARLAAYDLARWAGISDPRVTAALAKLDDRERAWEQRTSALTLSIRANARPTDVPFRLPGTAIDARVSPQMCAGDRGFNLGVDDPAIDVTCGIPVAIEESETARPPTLTFHALDARGRFAETELYVVSEGGHLVAPRGGRLPPGSQQIVLGLHTETTMLLRIGLPTGVIFVNVARAAR